MNPYYLAGLVIALVIAIIVLYVAWYKKPAVPLDGYDWEYQEEAKKHDDLKSGKFTEYEG